VERSPSLIDRILKYVGSSQVDTGFGAYVAPPVGVSESYEGLVTAVIREAAAAGDAVILAHGASYPLAGTAGLLRVLITGSIEARAARLAAGGLDAGKARKQVEESDDQRRAYLQRFYDVRQESPADYDLTMSTDTITPAAAASLVVAAARA
jgi:cytidylate kinase